jgi:hypothetical protein
MFELVVGGMGQGLLPMPVKAVLLLIILIGWIVTLIFSYIDMTISGVKFPGYARDSKYAPAYWTGVTAGLGPLIMLFIGKYL